MLFSGIQDSVIIILISVIIKFILLIFSCVIMPQLDIVPFATIFLWVISIFFIFYFIFLKYILPTVSQWLKTYNKLQVYLIKLLYIYDQAFFSRETIMQELLIKSANFMLSLSLLSKNIFILVPNFLTTFKVSVYEKSTVYLIKKCFTVLK